MGANKKLEQVMGIKPRMNGRERGQILLLVALFMVGLLVATGLAVDVGFLMIRKSQFDRAVDSAALTGVTIISATDNTSLVRANARGRQMLGANGIVIPDSMEVKDNPATAGVNEAGLCPADGILPMDNPATTGVNERGDYCGQVLPGSIPGATRYRIIVRWNVPTFFMPLININNVFLTSDAMAEYYPVVDMYASDIGEQGLVKSAFLSAFGPNSCTGNGDAYVPSKRQSPGNPESTWYSELNGVYTYRIAVPSSYAFDQVRIEIFDPDSYNRPNPSEPPPYQWYQYTSGTPYLRNSDGNPSCDDGGWGGQSEPVSWCTQVGGTPLADNPNWFYRVDEWRGPLCNPGVQLTRTFYRLFYWEKTPEGDLREVDLAYYIGEENNTEAIDTDMKWVSPGAPCPGMNYDDPACELMPPFNHTGPKWPLPSLPPTDIIPPSSVGEPATTTETCSDFLGANLNGVFTDNANRCEGDGNFIVNLAGASIEVPNIYQDPNTIDPLTGKGLRHIYLQVIPFTGASENVFSLWAGPPRRNGDASTPIEAPAEINARQIFLLRKAGQTTPEKWHRSKGLVVYGVGHMTMNWEASDRVRFPLASLDSTFSGQTLNVEVFDTNEAELARGDASPIYFFLDSISTVDWSACFTDGSNNTCTQDPNPLDDPNPTSPGSPDWTMDPDTGFKCSVLEDPAWGQPLITDGGDCLGVNQPGTHPAMRDLWARYSFVIPSEYDREEIRRIPFIPGRLYVSYKGRLQETNSWKMTVDARPVLVG